MAQPFNYTIQAPSAFESLVSGLRLGTSLEEMRLQQEQRAAQVAQAQQKAMQEQQQQTRLQEIYGKLNAGTATIADRIELGDISGSEATRKGIWETIGRMDENALNARIGTTQQFAFALNKNPELAKSMMDDYLRANPADQTMKRIRQMADMDPKFASEALMMALPGMGQPGLNAYKETVDRLFPAAQDPVAAREALAKADKAVADATTAQAQAATAAEKQTADLAKARADADLARVQAQVAQYEQRVGGGVELTPDIRTAIAATKLSPDQKTSLIELAQAKSSKTTVALPEQQKAEDVAFGKLLVSDFEEVRKLADSGRIQLANLKVAQRVLDAGFRTGFGTEWKAAAAAVLSALGVKDATKFATNAQVFLAQSRGALLTKQLEQKGPQTENDAKRIDQTGAALGNTVDANRFILAHAEAIAERNIERATFWQQYRRRRENGTFDGADEAYAEGPGSKSIFDYAPLKKYATIIPEQTWKNAPAPNPAAPTMQGGAQPAPAATTRRPLDQILGK
jgi:hypothetical protein